MKRFFLVSILFVFAFSVQAQFKTLQELIGRWDIAGEQNTGAYLEVVDSTTVILNYNGESRKLSNIRIDCSKSPCWFDFNTQDTSNSLLQVKSLMEVAGNSTMKWQLFVEEERSRYFTASKGELLYLRRSKSAATTTAKNE